MHKAKKARNYANNIPTLIQRYARQADKVKGRPGNDLTKEFVADLIKNGCAYCGATDLRMTVDRVDNNRAHSQDNVQPSCIRCNYVRGSMPYEAWLVLAPAMKEARERGLFGDWRTRWSGYGDQATSDAVASDPSK